MSTDRGQLRDAVRARYASAATQFVDTAHISDDGGCGPGDCGDNAVRFDEDGFGARRYSATDQDGIPADAVAASLGCGNPLAVADLSEGDVVLDLGSGAGLDVLLSARRVGPTGKAYGLDMTEEMLALAEANKREAGATNVEFLHGTIEHIPLPDGSVDVVISNCVINLSADKPAVFAQAFRVLRPGGRFGVTDVVATDEPTVHDRPERGTGVGCIAGALTFAEYRAGLTEAGFGGIEITSTHEVAEGMISAIVKATKP